MRAIVPARLARRRPAPTAGAPVTRSAAGAPTPAASGAVVRRVLRGLQVFRWRSFLRPEYRPTPRGTAATGWKPVPLHGRDPVPRLGAGEVPLVEVGGDAAADLLGAGGDELVAEGF